ncbi:hypothetical protein MCETHM1_00889 [Flavobacteriaceae bacterium]
MQNKNIQEALYTFAQKKKYFTITKPITVQLSQN